MFAEDVKKKISEKDFWTALSDTWVNTEYLGTYPWFEQKLIVNPDGKWECYRLITDKNPYRQGYYFTVTDPDEDDFLLELEVDFGDGLIVERCGCDIPWDNGETVEVEHKWKKSGDYFIKAKVKDYGGFWSDWGTLEITVVKQKDSNDFNQWVLRLFQRFPILEFLK